MMGVGKSTIGKAVSKRLSMEFIDIDKIIEKKLKLSVQKIFERKGEVFFREFEEKVAREEIKKKNRVISLGGGAFMNAKIRDCIILHGKSFLFKFNNFIGNVFFYFFFWRWKIKFTQ